MLLDLARVAPPVDGRQSANALAVQRGIGRLLRAEGFVTVTELPLATGRRADVVALGPGGEIWIVEIKSSVEDFRVDQKWPEYRFSCDRLFFATHKDVPLDIFPGDAGLILADPYGGEVIRHAPEHRLAAATRKAMLIRFAHAAAARLGGLSDPWQAGTLF
jgi:hypothetical protein